MTAERSLILFEVNELPFRVVDWFAKSTSNNCFASLLTHGKCYTTVCEDRSKFDPWISWPTLHRGVIDDQHQIGFLGQTIGCANESFPPIWALLAKNDKRVGVFASLHTSKLPEDTSNYCFYIPDPFAEHAAVLPKGLEPFQNFNLVMSRRSARNVDSGIPKKELFQFLRTYAGRATFGVSKTLAQQLVNEVVKRHLKGRRRSLQAAIGFDFFEPLMKSTHPDFATFFTNHVAAAMHRFWGATFPNDVPGNPMPESWRRKFGNEIPYAMGILDTLLARAKAFVDANKKYKLLIASSIGQKGVPKGDTKGFATITDLPRFLSAIGVRPDEWEERYCMVPSRAFVVKPELEDRIQNVLLSVMLGGRQMVLNEKPAPPISFDRREGSFRLYVNYGDYDGPKEIQIGNRTVSFAEAGLDIFVPDEEVSNTGRHIANGILCVYDPQRAYDGPQRMTVSTLDIAPSILANFGVTPPAYMKPAAPDLFDTGAKGIAHAFTVTTEEQAQLLDRVT